MRGVLRRETEVFITSQAALAGRLGPLFPEATSFVMSLVNKALPETGTGRPKLGAEVRKREPASVRAFGSGPARRYNETRAADAT